MIFWRLLFGAALVVIALWIIVGEQITGVSANATINARLVTLRSPIAGDVVGPPRELGSSVNRGEVLATVTDPQADVIRRDDLVMELALADAAVARFTGLLEENATLLAALDERSATYRAARIAEIETRLGMTRDRLRLLEDGTFEGGFDINPPQLPGADPGSTPEAEGLQQLWISAVLERIEALELELTAARGGVFIGDSYNDAPNSEQRATEIEGDLAVIRGQLQEASDRRAAFEARLAAERLRVNTARQAEIDATVPGRFWEILAADGENVQRGDPVVRLLDCGSVFVTASVSEQVYNNLAFGQAAVFRPTGDDRSHDATVIRLAGAGAETIYRNLAVAPSAEHLQRYDVALLVPGLASDPELACAVGRTGRVFFDGRPLDWFRGLLD